MSAAARAVGDHALRGRAFGLGHVPVRGSSRNEHGACGGAGAAQIVLRGADRAARARRHVAPNTIALAVLVRRRELGLHLAPVAFELFRDQHRQRRKAALAHLGLGDADNHGVIRLDHDPGGDLPGRSRGMRGPRGTERNFKAENQRAAHGGDAGEEGAAVEVRNSAHGFKSEIRSS
jgi:hypothetical protein